MGNISCRDIMAEDALEIVATKENALTTVDKGKNEKLRKSSLVNEKTRIRKKSSVCFDDSKTVIRTSESVDQLDINDDNDKDTLGDLREIKCTEEDVPVKFQRKFQDSLKLRRKKSNSDADKFTRFAN